MPIETTLNLSGSVENAPRRVPVLEKAVNFMDEYGLDYAPLTVSFENGQNFLAFLYSTDTDIYPGEEFLCVIPVSRY